MHVELPRTYKGYSTIELMDLWDRIANRGGAPGTPEEKIRAMDHLLREYKLAATFRKDHAPEPTWSVK